MEQLLTTKLYIPHVRSALVGRPALIEKLNVGLDGRLTLISAPAGFGKTTMAAEWVESLSPAVRSRVAWFSLDEGDNDLPRFFSYFVSALSRMQDIKSGFGKEVLALLKSSKKTSVETMLTALINEIAAMPERLILVLDDYHLIEAQSIHDALGFALDNLPPQLHLVMVTREDPLLPLSRLRARGQMTELRAADLRFTSAEAAEFLNQVMGLNLSMEDVEALERRTEGWIAGLQLAAISLQGQPDASQLIRSFTGSNRLVLDYLVDEVLDRQPQDIQSFLLRTAILERLCGPLCDAVTGHGGGQATLEMLERANLFIVPLDSERDWYRYHHLFAELLRQRLGKAAPEQILGLHQRASRWYQQEGQWLNAIRHAFAVEDLERVADLAELSWRPMNLRYQAVTWLSWVKALPLELVRARPTLSAGCGWASLDAGNLESADFHLRNAEQWLEAAVKVHGKLEAAAGETQPAPSLGGVALEPEEFRSLSISVANGRAYLAQALGDVTSTVRYARRASDLLREDDYFDRGLSEILPGFAYWASGNLEAAHRAIAAAISNMQMTDRVLFVISFTSYLADIMVAQGRLQKSIQTYLQLLETVAGQSEREIQESAVLHLGLSEIYLEQGDMEAARQHLKRSEALGEQPSFAPWYRHWIYAHARYLQVRGDWAELIEMLSRTENLYYRHPIPDIRPVAALKTRAWIAQGNLAAALQCLRERGLSVEDDLHYLREFEHITLARVLIAQFRRKQDRDSIQKAVHLLDRLLEAANEGRRWGSVIEILVLQAMAFEAQGEVRSALAALERALAQAEPERYFRIFIDEGPPLARLLYKALDLGISQDYVGRLLAGFKVEQPQPAPISEEHAAEFDWVEPLSEREMDVLRLVAEGFSNQEIATRLYVSLNTVKAHTRNIYGKLDAHNRTQAVARARALGILALV